MEEINRHSIQIIFVALLMPAVTARHCVVHHLIMPSTTQSQNLHAKIDVLKLIMEYATVKFSPNHCDFYYLCIRSSCRVHKRNRCGKVEYPWQLSEDIIRVESMLFQEIWCHVNRIRFTNICLTIFHIYLYAKPRFNVALEWCVTGF